MLTFIACFAALAVAAQGGPSDPEPRPDGWWVDRHNFYKSHTASHPDIPIIFYGDSITEGWGGTAWGSDGGGNPVFNQFYHPLRKLSVKIAGRRLNIAHIE